MVRVGGMLSANKVRYTLGDEPRTSSSDVGLALLAGIKADLDENKLIKAHIQRTDGNSALIADYGFGNYDMVFNPNTGEVEFAGQTTRDGSRGDTTRISVAVYYDF